MESIEIAFSFFVERFHEARVAIIARILMQAIVKTADDTLGITSNSTTSTSTTITITTTTTTTTTTSIDINVSIAITMTVDINITITISKMISHDDFIQQNSKQGSLQKNSSKEVWVRGKVEDGSP